jgi:pimeloyl-ACP methyl ester carboxylesterase
MIATRERVQIPVDQVVLAADVVVPESARGVVVFAHGSGSSRHSPRNQLVAAELQRAGLATVLTDLLTVDEEQLDATSGRFRFEIELLGARVAAIVDWTVTHEATADLALGLFGASTGAAAALVAAAAAPSTVLTVVSRGGRPDLAGERLRAVHQPVLLVVGAHDEVVLDLNRQAQRSLGGSAELVVVPGATHLFEEPGTLDQVAARARDWFVQHLGTGPAGGRQMA